MILFTFLRKTADVNVSLESNFRTILSIFENPDFLEKIATYTYFELTILTSIMEI